MRFLVTMATNVTKIERQRENPHWVDWRIHHLKHIMSDTISGEDAGAGVDVMLEATALYDQENFKAARLLFEKLLRKASDPSERRDLLFNISSCLASEANFGGALEILQEFEPKDNDLLYNIALCHYKLLQYDAALKYIDLLISNCRDLHPELSIESEPTFATSVEASAAISQKLMDSHIVEGLNLKSAIEFKTKRSFQVAQQSLRSLPIKSEQLLDCVTLHNMAIYESSTNVERSIDKLLYLAHLAKNGHPDDALPCVVPAEVYQNTLTLLLVGDELEVAKEYMMANRGKLEQSVQEDLLRFFEIQAERGTDSAEISYRKLDSLLDHLLAEWQQIYNETEQTNENRIKLSQVQDLVLIVATNQGSILWDSDQYVALERLLKKVEPVCKEEVIFKEDLAHTIYMQEDRYADCLRQYQDLLHELDGQSLLCVDPLVLGNLCVAYVLTGKNASAEALIKKVEAEESSLRSPACFANPALATRQVPLRPQHLCIVNIVIGTLYCVKHNYQFGLDRIFRSLEPLEERLHTNTWFHVKRVILSLLDSHCKQLIYGSDDLMDEVVLFLIECERLGLLVETAREKSKRAKVQPVNDRSSVTYEARYLRSILLQIIHD